MNPVILDDVDFCNGEKHTVGQRIDVAEETAAYHNVHSQYYDKEDVTPNHVVN